MEINSKRQVVSAIAMTLAGLATAHMAQVYVPKTDKLVPVHTELTAKTNAAPDNFAQVKKRDVNSLNLKVFVPSTVQLNAAYFYPDGADRNDVFNSIAGTVYQELMILDQQWLEEIYSLSGKNPEQMAAGLGIAREKILGKYNRENLEQNPEDPDTWVINNWKDVNISICNGDGQEVSGVSNAKDILSMASVYTYYHDMEDRQAFSDYAKNLWKLSHSFDVSISDVYYCDGCLQQQGEAGETLSEPEAGPAHEGTAESEAAAETQASQGEKSMPPETGTTESSENGTESAAAETSDPETEPQTEPETKAQSCSITEAVEGTLAGPGAFLTDTETKPDDEADQIETKDLMDADCPGHVDLHVKVRVLGISEMKNLFACDNIGNSKEHMSDIGWRGWNERTKSYVSKLSVQDWFERYQIPITETLLSSPLTESEIEGYMKNLPEGISDTRKEIVRFGLSSVGRVPYYWGGKPTGPGYEEQDFGTIVKADERGRVFKGLDCSGWINWVYWSATGKPLPCQNTTGLSTCGQAVDPSHLMPGDIAVRLGDDAHVIMFLGWTENGSILCIQETSGSANNVIISERDADWNYYRKLVDEE